MSKTELEKKPYMRLWLAVLLNACRDADSRDYNTAQPAIEWACSQSREIGSFMWICAALGLRDYRIRRELLRLVYET